MNGFDATRQKHRFPGHHTTTCTLNPPSKGYIKGKDGDERVIVDGCEIMKGNDITSVDEKSKKQTIRNATGASSQDDDDTGIKLKPEDNTAAKLSIQSQSGPQPPKGTHGITCKPAEAKKDVNDKSGRIAMSKAEAEVGHLLLPSKQAAYGDRENDRDEPKLEKTTVSPNIYQAEVGCYFYCSLFFINRILHDIYIYIYIYTRTGHYFFGTISISLRPPSIPMAVHMWRSKRK